MNTIVKTIIAFLQALNIEVMPNRAGINPAVAGYYAFAYKGFQLFRLTALDFQWMHRTNQFVITDPATIEQLEQRRNDNDQSDWFKQYDRTENVFKFQTMQDLSTQYGASDIESIKELVTVGFSDEMKAFYDDADRFGNENVQIVESGMGWGNDAWQNHATLTVRQLVDNSIVSFSSNNDETYYLGGYKKIDDLNKFVQLLQDIRGFEIDGDAHIRYTIEADAIEQENRQRMLKLEKQAASLMHANPNADLFEVLTNQIEIAQDRVEGLAEDGLCAVNPFSSSAMDDYNDLRCGLQGKVNTAYELLEYCEKQFPLQWLAFKEKQANEQLQLTR